MPADPGLPSLHRRHLLAAGGALALAACAPAGPPVPATPSAPDAPPPDPARFRIPGEFEPQRAIWLGYDSTLADTTVALVRALAPHTPLRFLVNDAAAADRVRDLLAARGLWSAGTSAYIEPLAMFYPRDGVVFASSREGELGVVDFRWNQYGVPAWCRRRHADDAAQAQRCAADHDTSRDALDRALARQLGVPAFASPLYLEGGGVESNGQGLLIACESLLRSRNPGLDRAELERLHLALPGVKRVIWLPEGLAHDPHLRASITPQHVAWGTGGHTDEFVRFADAATVLLAWPDEAEAARHPVARLNRQRMQRNAEILAASRTLDGQPLRVLRLPMPRIVERRVFLSAAADRGWFNQWTADFFPRSEGRREGDALMQVATASYLNFVIANGVVVLPDYLPHGTPRPLQARVQQLMEQAFPGRRIVFIDALALNWLGGGLHCATLHEPLPR
ncbi:MAG: agmatine deiminase family protein [Rubrivivax sp.]|nr:agmatine deiminase family protein [Rubrivivax sp.]